MDEYNSFYLTNSAIYIVSTVVSGAGPTTRCIRRQKISFFSFFPSSGIVPQETNGKRKII